MKNGIETIGTIEKPDSGIPYYVRPGRKLDGEPFAGQQVLGDLAMLIGHRPPGRRGEQRDGCGADRQRSEQQHGQAARGGGHTAVPVHGGGF